MIFLFNIEKLGPIEIICLIGHYGIFQMKNIPVKNIYEVNLPCYIALLREDKYVDTNVYWSFKDVNTWN